MEKITILNGILATNMILMKCIGFLYLNEKYGDVIFICNMYNIDIRAKSPHNMTSIGNISHECYDKLLLNIKMALGMNFLDPLKIHQSSFPVQINDTIYSFRISIHPSYSGNNLSIRIIRSSYFYSQNPEGFMYEGLTLIGGKTGSGKTTCYYSLLKNFPGNVISLEDPVEFPISGINQTDVNIGYDQAMKSVLRQVPDLIGVGEIRDYESAKAVINASLTGHTVIATVHFAHINQLKLRFEQMGIICNFPVKQILFLENKTVSLIPNNNLLLS